MRTDELIQVLARDVRSPAPRLEAQLWTAAALGSMLSLLAFALALGPRDDLITALSAPLFIGKVAVLVIFAATVASALPATARPGSALRWGRVLLAPVLVVLLATIDLGAYPADTWVSRLLGTNAYVCLTAIPLLALAPLLGLLLGLRSGAPTRPALAGGLAGVLAGALAASLYAFHCADDSPLFVATWYSLAILIVAGLGAATGALMLRR
jgi:hypothetical protein